MSKIAAAFGALAATVALGACGGGPSQDSTEPVGQYPIDVTKAKFLAHQKLSQRTNLEVSIKNIGDQTLPDLAITIWIGEHKANGSFNVLLDNRALSNPSRPVWILENRNPKVIDPGISRENTAKGPSPYTAAQTDTFQFGPLEPGQSTDVLWQVTPVMAGTYTVHYQIAAGLQGNAEAVTADGGEVSGDFVVTISSRPPKTCVDDKGNVVEGRCQIK